jgi:hypothetical protein
MIDDVFQMPEPSDGSTPQPSKPIPPVSSSAQSQRSTFRPEDVDAGGAQLARDMEAKGYQPVILIGNAFSGKTSVLLSLLSTIKVDPSLKTGIFMADTLLPRESRYGKYQAEHSNALFNKKVQDFIDGQPIQKTALDVPFFVTVSLRPSEAPHITFAFMESNGEMYSPKREDDSLYPSLKGQIEDFIANYQGGIIFLYLLPYTQQSVRSIKADSALDNREMADAELAVVGLIRAYDKIRVDKTNDMHLMLITKWDAHDPGSDIIDTLSNPDFAEIERTATVRYGQVLTSLQGMGLRKEQVKMQAYCSGLMNEGGVLNLNHNNQLRPIVLEYPKKLWSFIYENALRNAGISPASPFPSPKPTPIWQRFLDRFF